MRWITPHFFMSVCFRQVDCFVLQVKFVDDSVRQADNRNMDIRGSDNIGDSQENFTSRNDYIRAVGFHAELFHTFFQRKRFQACVQLL